jgi:death-on-curing protein
MTPEWVDHALVPDLHDIQIAKHGGASGLRDANMLASGLARPENLFAYGEPPPDLFDLAAAYAYGLARNHAFADGNKRISLVVTALFLELNGHIIVAPTQVQIDFWRETGAGQHDEAAIAAWLRNYVQPLPTP